MILKRFLKKYFKFFSFVGIIFLANACSLKNQPKDIKVSFQVDNGSIGVQKTQASSLAKSLLSLGGGAEVFQVGTGTHNFLPTDVLGFDCIVLNVMGPGIESVDPQDPRNSWFSYRPFLEQGKGCAYPGVLSPMYSPLQKRVIDLMVPSGPHRLIQVIGVQSEIGCRSDQDFYKTVKETEPNSDYIFPHILEIGRTVKDLFSDQDVVVYNQYNSANPNDVRCGPSGGHGTYLPIRKAWWNEGGVADTTSHFYSGSATQATDLPQNFPVTTITSPDYQGEITSPGGYQALGKEDQSIISRSMIYSTTGASTLELIVLFNPMNIDLTKYHTIHVKVVGEAYSDINGQQSSEVLVFNLYKGSNTTIGGTSNPRFSLRPQEMMVGPGMARIDQEYGTILDSHLNATPQDGPIDQYLTQVLDNNSSNLGKFFYLSIRVKPPSGDTIYLKIDTVQMWLER